ncbi:MAG: OmpA family protein, partial [Pseudoxanthomonas sp.]
ASVQSCQECSSDSNCTMGSYCVKDWGPTPPDGLCQQCNVPDHCGADCMVCGTADPICTASGCVQCLVDTDCPADNRCDLTAHTCQPVSPNWQYLGGCSTVAGHAQGPVPLGLFGAAGVGLLALYLLHRRRLLRRAPVLLVLGLVAMGPGRARADLSANTQTFHPAIGAENIITVEGSRTGKRLRPLFNVLLEYSHRTLRLVDGDTGLLIANTVPDALTVHLMAGMGFTSWLALAVDLPVVAYQGFDRATPIQDVPNTPSSYGIGDLRLVAKFRIVNNERGGFGVAFVPQVTFPAGDPLQLRGDDAYGIEPRLALDYRTPGGAIIALNLGFLGRTSNQILRGMEVGSQVRYGIGMYVPLPESFGLLGEVAGGTSVNNLPDGNIYSPLEGHVGGRWVHSSGVNVNLGAGMGFTQAVGTPQFRLFAALGYLPIGGKKAMIVAALSPGRVLIEKSGSGIGVVTSTPEGVDCGQNCKADFKSGVQVVLKAHPDPTSHFTGWAGPCSGTADCVLTVRGTTRVGVEFAHNEEQRSTVTIEKFGDGQGLVSSNLPGIACGEVCSASYRLDQELRITAVAEKGSRFSGWEGPCSGFEPCTLVVRNDPRLKAGFIKSQVVITDTKLDLQGNVIHFETAKSNIDIDSYHLLDEVVLILKERSAMKLRIEGHTDAVPFYAPGGNRQLSRDRAASVLQYLVGHGITGARLGSEGYGDTCPVSTNQTPDGRQANRRTEFLLVDAVTGKFESTPCVAYTPAPKAGPRKAATAQKSAKPAGERTPPAAKLPKK